MPPPRSSPSLTRSRVVSRGAPLCRRCRFPPAPRGWRAASFCLAAGAGVCLFLSLALPLSVAGAASLRDPPPHQAGPAGDETRQPISCPLSSPFSCPLKSPGWARWRRTAPTASGSPGRRRGPYETQALWAPAVRDRRHGHVTWQTPLHPFLPCASSSAPLLHPRYTRLIRFTPPPSSSLGASFWCFLSVFVVVAAVVVIVVVRWWWWWWWPCLVRHWCPGGPGGRLMRSTLGAAARASGAAAQVGMMTAAVLLKSKISRLIYKKRRE